MKKKKINKNTRAMPSSEKIDIIIPPSPQQCKQRRKFPIGQFVHKKPNHQNSTITVVHKNNNDYYE